MTAEYFTTPKNISLQDRLDDFKILQRGMNVTRPLKWPESATTESSGMLPDMYRLSSVLRQSFENLFDRWHDAGCRLSEQEKTQLIDLEARFSVWGRTVGAFRRSQSSASLDSRLVTAARLRQHIADNLELLACALIDIEQIGFGTRENREVAVRELTDDERMLKEFEAELAATSTSFRHLTTTVEHTITTFACTELADELILANQVVASLLRTAVYITDNAPRERYFRSQRATVADLFRDIGHLKDKFPYLDRNKPWLLERLARANVSTRQYLTYREDHYDNIAQSDEDDEARASQSSQRDGRSRPSTEATKVSQDIDPTTLEKDDGQSESASSITPSVVGSLAVRFPALPEELDSGKRFCPLCRTIINLGSSKPRERWHKHVLHDLEPYVCTFDRCTENPFPSRRQWFEHEVRAHRQLWSCQICKNLITRRLEEFEAHISKCLVRHRDSSATDPSDISLLIRACQSPMRVVKPAECPFCGYDWLQIHVGVSHSDTSVSLQAYRAHVGEHLLDEALFSLRQMHLEWEDEGEDKTTYAGSSASSAALLEDDSLSEVRGFGDLLTHSLTTEDREDRADVAPPEEVADIIASREDDPDDSISSERDYDFVSSSTLIREHEADDNEVGDDEVIELPRNAVTASKDFVLPNKVETAHDDAEETANPDTAQSSSLPRKFLATHAYSYQGQTRLTELSASGLRDKNLKILRSRQGMDSLVCLHIFHVD